MKKVYSTIELDKLFEDLNNPDMVKITSKKYEYVIKRKRRIENEGKGS